MPILESFTKELTASLKASLEDSQVVALKSIACYRTGLDISTWSSPAAIKFSLLDAFKMFKDQGKLRLAHKSLNDHTVRIALSLAGNYGKPGNYNFLSS